MFAKIFIDRPRLAIVIALFMMLAGILCITRLPVEEYPQVAPPTIMIMATYPGASGQTIADTVAAPLETEINGIEDLLYYSTTSDNSGGLSISLTFRSGIDEDIALVNVNNAIKRAERSLPAEVTAGGVRSFKRSSDILGVMAAYSTNPAHDSPFVNNYVNVHLADTLSRVDGVGQVLVFSDLGYAMRVWLDPHRMRALGISVQDINAAIASQNVQAAAGSVGTEQASNYMQFQIDTQGRLFTPEEFSAVVVKAGENGRLVRLGDVARVELGSEFYSGPARFRNHEAIAIAIFKLNDANALQVMRDVKAEIDSLRAHFPEGLEIADIYDSTTFVEMTMREIVETLLITFVLVVLITYVFLQDWRATIVPTVAIPVSLISTFFFMFIFGMSINTLTMFGLILAIGSVVDDAITVVESCVRLINEEGLSPYDAAIRSMKELMNALIATTLVILAVYAPIAFYTGMVGTIYLQFSVVLCIALALSTINAITLSPALCALVLRPAKKPNVLFKAFNAGVDGTKGLFRFAAEKQLRHSIITVAIFAGILSINFILFKQLPSEFIPNEDKGAMFCEVVLPAGAPIRRTEAVIAEIAEIVDAQPGVNQMISIIGRSLTTGNGENLALGIIDLDSWNKRTTPETQIDHIRRELMAKCAGIPDAVVTLFTPPAITGLSATNGVTFSLQAVAGQSSQELAQATTTLLAKLRESGNVIFAFTSFDASTPMLHLDINRAKAEAMNVPISAIFHTLQTQLGSMYINDFNLDSRTYRVKVQSDVSYRENLNIVSQLTVMSTTGQSVPLDSLTTIEWTLGPRQVERFNMFPSAAVNTLGMPGVSSGEVMNLIRHLVANELPEGYQISWTDMSYQEQQNEGQIISLLILSFLFVYLFLVAQYESWTMPISVILSCGTATAGAMIAMKLTGMTMNIYCQLGLLMLIGLTSKSAILMVEFAKKSRDDGATIEDAALEGLRVRFRAVMMTALSFVVGIAPMVFASGAGANSRRAIGTTTFWGMVAASFIGILFLPGLFAVFQRLGENSVRAIDKVFKRH